MHDQAVSALSQAEARQYRRRDPPSAEKNDRAHATFWPLSNLTAEKNQVDR
jgi:hypothetical protein